MSAECLANGSSPLCCASRPVRAGETHSTTLSGLLGTLNKLSLEDWACEVVFASALSGGETWLQTALWKELDFAFRRLLRNGYPFDAERLLRKPTRSIRARNGQTPARRSVSTWRSLTRVWNTASRLNSHRVSLRHGDRVSDPPTHVPPDVCSGNFAVLNCPPTITWPDFCRTLGLRS